MDSIMIRCVRIWTEEDNNSHFEESWIDLVVGKMRSPDMDLTTAAIQKTTSIPKTGLFVPKMKKLQIKKTVSN